MAMDISKITARVPEQGLVWLFSLILLVLIGQSLAGLFWQVLDDDTALEATASTSPPVINRSTSSSAILLAQAIANQHLFGRADSRQATQRGADAPETKLNLLLKGVIASSDEENAVAFIAAGKGTTEKSYAIGDNLPGGAILKDIYEERVLLEYRGRMENLSLRRKVLTKEELGTQ